MSYVVFARRYRPQNFDQIIGQEHISRTLKNAIAENRVAHAYLFSGPRGVGKTTTARILAKALNCRESKTPTSSPCGKCSNCTEITAGTSVDVQEIDGASNRGIDEIRSLRENVKFAPASSRYKIYIIDEAHQITDAAFNALLKTLEEPPEHVVFILATTEPQKIPVTILSRCQRYRFRLLSNKEIMSTLERIVQTEKLRIETAALQLITGASGGSLRDSLSLLDQSVSFVSGEVTLNDVHTLLGFLPDEIITGAAEALAAKDGARILEIVRDINDQGYNLLQFARDLREYLRKLLLFKLNPSVLEINDEQKNGLERRHQQFSPAWLIRSGHILSKALDEMRWSEHPRLILELHALKLVQPYVDVAELMERLERIERGGGAASSLEEAEERKLPVERGSSMKPAPASQRSEPVPEPARETRKAEEPGSRFVTGELSEKWGEVITDFQKSRPLRMDIFSGAVPKEIRGNSIVVTVKSRFQEQGMTLNKGFIEEIIALKFGKPLGISVVVDEGQDMVSSGEETLVVEEESKVSPVEEVYKVESDVEEVAGKPPAGLEKILEKFPGKVTKKR